MLGTLLEKKLKELQGSTLLVVMDDGTAFAGKLVEFDKTTIVLNNIYQGSASQIDWKEVSPEEKETIKHRIEEEGTYGFVDWTAIALKEVYIRVEHISRIWPWELISEPEEKHTENYERPVYFRKRVEMNRALGMDMPDSPF